MFYDGTKLLSLLDKNGNKPEIYICTSNRSAGKTTFFSRYLINKFKKEGKKFGVFYRYNYELSSSATAFFKDINYLFFPQDELTGENRANGKFVELFLNEIPCGYAIAINNAEPLKKYSHFFSDIEHIMFDEFMSESGKYCPHEIDKFISLHTSIARGQNKQVRRVPVYLIGNPITLLNPYYAALDISNKLNSKTKFLRGNGFVLEQGFNSAANDAQKASLFNTAFQKSNYVDYAAEGKYLSDNSAFIAKLSGKNNYILTIKYKNEMFALKEYPDLGIVYCTDIVDISFPRKIALTTDDHDINYIMLEKFSPIIGILKKYFEKGVFRFKNLKCKKVVLDLLSY